MFLWTCLLLSMLLWISIWISLDLYGYLWISMDIHALTCYGFSIQGRQESGWSQTMYPKRLLLLEIQTLACSSRISDSKWKTFVSMGIRINLFIDKSEEQFQLSKLLSGIHWSALDQWHQWHRWHQCDQWHYRGGGRGVLNSFVLQVRLEIMDVCY